MNPPTLSKSSPTADLLPPLRAARHLAFRNHLHLGLQFLMMLVFTSILTPLLFAAAVTTDKSDYPPGATAIITGTGWAGGEMVTLQVTHADPTHLSTGEDHEAWIVTADGDGGFTTSWHVCQDDCVGQWLLLTAVGTSSGTATALFSDTGPGTAPMHPPTGGFGIDGDLYANTPTAYIDIGDWTGGPGGTGTGVLDAVGNPLNEATTFRLTDPYNSGVDDNFAGGKKVNDNPNLWTWVSNPVGDKVDINNALIHFSTDNSGHQWLAIAGDRLSDNGDAYIDFEFLQKTLTANVNGTFSSAGLEGGRTVNDFIVTVKLTKGGSTAEFFVQRWQAVGTGYDYVDYAAPVGATFAAVNPATITSPYPAFGGTTYLKNTFSEAAVDLTALLGSFDPCLSLGIRTVMVKTKVSQAATATIVDFISPLQVSLTLGVANAGPDQSICSSTTTAEFALSGTATPSPGDTITSTTWSVVSGTASIAAADSLNTTATVTSPSATLRLTVETTKGCTVTDDVILTVKTEPVCSIELLTPIPLAGEPVSFRAPTGSDSYAWSVEYDDSGTPLPVDGNIQNPNLLTFTIDATAKTAVVRLVATNLNGCTSSCSYDLTITSPGECITVENPVTCPNEQQTASLNGNPPPGTEITWTILSDDEPTPQLNISADKQSATITSTTCAEYTITITTTLNGITSTCTTNGRFEDLLPPIITCPPDRLVDCAASTDPAVTGLATATDNCGSVVPTYIDTITQGNCAGNYVIARTWTTTDGCGNTATCVQTITVVDTVDPLLVGVPANDTVECDGIPAAPNVTATDNCDTTVPVNFTETSAGTCPTVITRTWTAIDDCGNGVTASQTLTVVDTVDPLLVGVPADDTVECDTIPAAPTVTATDNCDTTVPVTFTETSVGTCPTVITRTWTASDDCGNEVTASQTLTVVDTVDPLLVGVPADDTVECDTIPAAPTVTATDNCDTTVPVTFTETTVGTCPTVITRTWTAIDDCGNEVTASQTLTVVDTVDPLLVGVPADDTVECDTIPAAPTVTATDNCDTTVPVSFTETSVGTCPTVITRTWTASDDCGNEVTASQTLTVVDTVDPLLVGVPADDTVECDTIPAAPTVTATDNCDTTVPVTFTETSAGTCPTVITRTWTAIDDCGNEVTASQTLTVVDTVDPLLVGVPADDTVECDAVPTAPTVTATDNCDTIVPVTFTETSVGTCPTVITRTWTAIDDCGNEATASQTLTVVDTTPPLVPVWLADVNLTCAECDIDPRNTGTPVVNADNCGTVTTSYEDVADSGEGTCPRVVKRLWTVSDGCNEVTHEQIIQCLPTSKVVVTNSSLCSYDMDPSTDCKDFRLLLTQDPKNHPKYKITASNPGQTYYNLFYNGIAGSTVTFNITLPYPYVTQGAQPIHAYDGVTVRMENGEECYEPERAFYVGSTQKYLNEYITQTYGSATSFSVPLVVPSTGFIYLNIHLDYGLKGSTGYLPNANGDVLDSTSKIIIPNRGTYTFSSSFGSESVSDSICNINVFKKLPGVGGLAAIPYTTPDGITGKIAKAGCTAVLKDSKGTILANGVTDSDGWYFCNFKWTGRQSTIFVTLTPPGRSPITRSATLKSNGYVQIDFEIP